MLWLAWEDTKNEKYKELAMKHIPEFYDHIYNKIGVNHHDMAYKHFRTALNNTVRENAGSHQTYFFDAQTGAPLYGKKDQGLTDDTTWSRGQG